METPRDAIGFDANFCDEAADGHEHDPCFIATDVVVKVSPVNVLNMSTSAAEEAFTETVTETFRPAQSCVLETWNVAHPGNEGSEQAKNSAVGLAGGIPEPASGRQRGGFSRQAERRFNGYSVAIRNDHGT